MATSPSTSATTVTTTTTTTTVTTATATDVVSDDDTVLILQQLPYAGSYYHHTQNRPDRNEHIAVHLDNVLDPSQYERCTDCKVFGTDYDCMSIMHYRWNSLAVDRSEPTMTPLPGQNCDLRSRNRSFPSIRAYISNMRQQVSYLVRY